MTAQDWIHHWEEGAGARALRVVAALLAFAALASLYDLLSYDGFASEEAMENAQLARNISEGKGYTTDSIRPVALYLLAQAADPGQSSKVLSQPVPDLNNAPVYPSLLAGLMKALPFKFEAKQFWYYQPERWISIFNQGLFFVAVLVVFFLARRLFDAKVAWLATALFAGTSLFWKFSVSGLSTIWLILIFLVVTWIIAAIEERNRLAAKGEGAKGLFLALLAGALLGVGGLTRYAAAWMLIPVLLFVWWGAPGARFKLCLTITLAFLAVMAPWVVRNIRLSGHCFGAAGYAVVQQTASFPDDTLERSTDPRGGMQRLAPTDIVNKFLANAREICMEDVPKFGGNWIWAFFLVGLLIPFRNIGLTRLRWFLVGSLALLLVVEAVARTHVSIDAPVVNSENLLIIVSPLVFIYGAALFHILLDQLNLPPFEVRSAVVATFIAVLCAPFLFTLLQGHQLPANSPYSPLHVQQTSQFAGRNELMSSDIPGGVAWYGGRSCVWLPLDNDKEFFKVNALKPIRALFLTQVTTDKRFLSQMKYEPKGWGAFVLECAEHGEVPTGFPLRKAPVGLLPEQLFLSAQDRWHDHASTP